MGWWPEDEWERMVAGRPVKLDNLVMGHLCPHVHCHVLPQYRADDPHALINPKDGDVVLSDGEQRARVAAMRQALLSARE